MLSDLRVNQWIAHLTEDHPLAQQHTSLLQATDSINMDVVSQPPAGSFNEDFCTNERHPIHTIVGKSEFLSDSLDWDDDDSERKSHRAT
jgi:hypothetical protein